MKKHYLIFITLFLISNSYCQTATGKFSTFSTSNLPIVIINTGGVPIQDEPSIFATMGIINNGEGNINTVTDIPNDYNGNISIEFRGNYSQSLPQKPYKIETLNADNTENDVSLLGMPKESDWILLANYNDKAFMRNTLAYKIFSEMGHYAAKSHFCEVVVNGNYQGIYLLMEKIKRDKNRVDIAKLETTENSGIDLTGGYIIKNDYWDSTDSWLLEYHPIDHPNFDVHLVYEYPKPENITSQQKTYIQSFINNFETALYSTNYTSATIGYRSFIDVNSFVDYLIVNELSRNNDGFKKSSYFHKDKDPTTSISKLVAGPVWDFDWAWKNIDECSIFAATDGSGWAYEINNCYPDVNSPGWYVRLLQDPNFQNDFRCRWNNLRTTTLSENAINNYIDATALNLEEAQQRHFEKWGNMGVNTGTPEVENDVDTFAKQITKFKSWINTRLTWLDENIPGNSNNCTLSVQENKSPSLILYPNPAQNYFSIQLPESFQEIAIKVTLFDMLGRNIKKFNLDNSRDKVDVSNLQKGNYIVQIEYLNNLIKTKLIVE